MMFKLPDGTLAPLCQASLQQYVQILSDLDWTFFKKEDPSLFTAGEIAIREAYLVAEQKGPEWQEAFTRLFMDRNPQAKPPEFRPVEIR